MDSTFMTIHNLSSDANILFASDSIYDILGYQPRDVEGRSCFDYFHPEEVPLARYVHGRGVLMDKAAALHYTRIRNVHGQWVGCECTFSVVHDILVACTSVYHRDEKSERRAQATPQVRRLFSSPQDPRFHMLGHLAQKFTMAPSDRELRAAIILNRFTRSLAIMFATNSVAEILGLEPSELQNKSFYECIDDSCLDDAMECIEAAKANDSIAYLRFWSRDARREDEIDSSDSEEDLSGDTLADGRSGSASLTRGSLSRRDSTDSEPGGVRLDASMDLDSPFDSTSPVKREAMSQDPEGAQSSSDGAVDADGQSHQAAQSSASENENVQAANTRHHGRSRSRRTQPRSRYPVPSMEIEAFVSCTSDGLVVILRKARQLPSPAETSSAANIGRQGIFAAPWAAQPVAAHYGPSLRHGPPVHAASQTQPQPVVAQQPVPASGGPPMDELMASIQEVAVFAWALVGINRGLSSYSHGTPTGNAQPPEDQYYNGNQDNTLTSAPDASGYGHQAQNLTSGAPTQHSGHGLAHADKCQPIEPPYTSYPEQGANQLRSNGPWSNGGRGNWRSQPQPITGHQPPSTGHRSTQQEMANVQTGSAWLQNANNQHGQNSHDH